MNSTDYIYDNYIIERRRSPRCEYQGEADYIVNEKPLNSGKVSIHNISRNGVLLSTFEDVRVGDRIDLFFAAPFYDFKKISLSGKVIRNTIDNNISFIAMIFINNIYQNIIDKFVKNNIRYY